MEVQFETKIIQVQDGSKYKGHLKIGKSTFDCEFTFSIHISQLEEELPRHHRESMQDIFVITVRRNNNLIPLNEKEYWIFVSLLLEELFAFYSLPQTRDSNKGMMGAMLRGESHNGVIPPLGMEISCTSYSRYEIPDDLCELLSESKFDCALAA